MQSVRFVQIVLFAVGMAGCRQASEPVERSPVRAENGQIVVDPGCPQSSSVSVEASVAPAPAVLSLNGRLVWDENVTTRLFTSVAGRGEKVTVEVGQFVKVGDPLVRITSPDYGQIQADSRRAATDLIQMERVLSRTKELFNHGAAAEKDLQAAEADAERARIEKQRAAERLALYGGAENGVDQCYVLKAPLAGIVVEKNISPGAELRSDQMLANVPQVAAPLFVITESVPGVLLLAMMKSMLPSPLTSAVTSAEGLAPAVI